EPAREVQRAAPDVPGVRRVQAGRAGPRRGIRPRPGVRRGGGAPRGEKGRLAMPMPDSGASLFAGSVEEFIVMAPASTLTAHLEREFDQRRWGFGPASPSEVRSWRNSLTALAKVVETSGLDATGVGVELKLPSTSKRVDAS